MNDFFYYFDGPEERNAVMQQIRDVRAEVFHIASQIPEQHHFLPRYNGRSLAETLVHLQLFDVATLWFIKRSAKLREDLKLRPPETLLRHADHLAGRFFRRRLVSTTLEGLRRQEKEICDYIRYVPLEDLHKDVFHPGRREPYTVEKALQVYFIHYWERQCMAMRKTESVFDESH
jgi:hypothetical protein